MQDFYVAVHQSEGTDVTANIPKHYPTSVLLGSVDVKNCHSVSKPVTGSTEAHYILCSSGTLSQPLMQMPSFIQADVLESWAALPESIKQEIGSPYGFLCQNPKRLIVPQQMRGYPKLWQLAAATAKTLSVALKPPPDPIPFSWDAFGSPACAADAPDLVKSLRSNAWFDKYGRQKAALT